MPSKHTQGGQLYKNSNPCHNLFQCLEKVRIAHTHAEREYSEMGEEREWGEGEDGEEGVEEILLTVCLLIKINVVK